MSARQPEPFGVTMSPRPEARMPELISLAFVASLAAAIGLIAWVVGRALDRRERS